MMKKLYSFPVGLFIGASLMLGVVVQAEEIKNFIGSQVEGQFPVTVNGEKIESPGIVVGGISYLPTRTIAELAGFEVEFDADLGVSLSAKEPILTESQEVGQPVVNQSKQVEDIGYQIQRIDEEIKSLQILIAPYQVTLERSNVESAKEEARTKIAELKSKIADLEAEKAELEAQHAETP